ncbi:MAG: hypothetical protein R3Y47_01020 [Lachnospiraceae bacterium]
MDSIIKGLYLGTIDKDMQSYVKDSLVDLAIESAEDIRDILNDQLTEKEKDLLKRYVSACNDVNNEIAISNFILGFKLGARITAESLYGII